MLALPRDARFEPDQVVRTAQLLLGARRDAEDIAQEAWLLYHRKPTGHVRDASPWLRVAVVHLARRVGLRNRLRAERERLAARPEGTPSVLEQLESSSLREHLANAVAGLRAPYREVVGLRYLEGCEIEEIAVRLRRSSATLRSQLKRGLALLRARLRDEAERWSAPGARPRLGERGQRLLHDAPPGRRPARRLAGAADRRSTGPTCSGGAAGIGGRH